jgi:hypothetical protein
MLILPLCTTENPLQQEHHRKSRRISRVVIPNDVGAGLCACPDAGNHTGLPLRALE